MEAASPRERHDSGNQPGLVAVVVDEAMHEGFGPSKHTTYRINTTLRSGSSSTCRHRFSEFLTLRTALVDSSPGVVIPPLPEKKVMNRFSSDFVEGRRLMLEVFLQRVVNHPLACVTPALASFLGWKEDICTVINNEMRGFVVPTPPNPVDGGDPLKDASALTASFEAGLVSVRTVLKRLQQKMQDAGLDYLEMSQAMQAMGDNSMNVTLRPSLVAFADGAHEIAGMTKRRAEGDKTSLLIVLKTYQLMTEAIQEQLKRRTALASSIDKQSSQLKDVQTQSAKLQGKAGKESKCAALDAQAAELRAKIERARAQHTAFTHTLLWELESFHKTKNTELHRALQEFAQDQEDYGLKAYDQWRNLALKLTGTGATAARAVERGSSGSFGNSPGGGGGGGGGGGDPFASGTGGFESLSMQGSGGAGGSAGGSAGGPAASATASGTLPPPGAGGGSLRGTTSSAGGLGSGPASPAGKSPGASSFGDDMRRATERKFSFDGDQQQPPPVEGADRKSSAFSMSEDPASLGPPPGWGTPFMPTLGDLPAEPAPPGGAAPATTEVNLD